MIYVIRPLCGDDKAHAAHTYTRGNNIVHEYHCSGQTMEAASVLAMVLTVREWLNENYPHSFVPGFQLPEGLRIEMHPSVRTSIMRNVHWSYNSIEDTDITSLFQVPIVVTPLLPTSSWRLVTVTEDVHRGGQFLR